MNGQPAPSAPPRRRTRAEQRAATRLAMLQAATACLIEDGYEALTSRRVAERAGVSQSTFMYHFPTRDEFLTEAVTHIALRLADEALHAIDLDSLRRPEGRSAVLDQAWAQFTSPEALAAAQLWSAAWTEPEVAATLRDIEGRIETILVMTASTLFPEQAENPRFPALIDTTVSLIRGLVMGIPVSGMEATHRRWEAIKPILLDAAADLLD